ncbi:MAG: hypothetical protein IJ548_04405 [Paludibacteraceae bacterium]|nr:hypothetical protein [Paludibacteraceae bacterium]MBQ9297129.1 hypothetical protein [Paludibacteraceae bacterium]MBR1556472.1 hypothetical protein [Prevotella sp.]
MKKWSRLALWALMIAGAPMPASAVKQYSCDFESAEARQRWVLNPTANQTQYNNLANKWYIGEQGDNDQNGHYGLYISDDNGVSAQYTNKGCWVVAYDTISLEHLSTSDDYTLSFDYSGMGNTDSNFDGLYLLWVPMVNTKGDSVKVMSVATSDGTIPTAYLNYVIPLQPAANMDYLNGAQTWKQAMVTIPNSECDGTPHYLVFVWANTSSASVQPGGMIDNIEITDARMCEPASNVTVSYNGATTTLSWNGTAAGYEVSVYSYEANQWYGPKVVSGTSTTFSSLPEGQADFIIRAQCAEDLFSLKTTFSDFVYYPDEKCIPFLSLSNENCYIANGKVSGDNWMNSMSWTKKYVNDGKQSIDCRHAKYYRKNEYDIRTSMGAEGPGLKTVPDGELASVRLGNWHDGGEAERIEYKFHVDSRTSAVLMLKYAVILEKPNESCKPNPGFLLRVLDNKKKLISDCASADFDYHAAEASSDPSWHKSTKELNPTNTNDVMWKDWTPVGINLSAYDGQDLTVQLTTYDCGAGGHYGYSYFTLHCSDGKFKDMWCGQINPTFEAPDGFKYSWAYRSSEQYRDSVTGIMPEEYVIGHDQIYEAGYHDDSVYVVDCMFLQDSACFFSLYASTLATNPIAVMEEPVVIKNCSENKYTLHLDGSKSWVQEIDHVKGDTLESQIYTIDRYEWNITGPHNFWSDEVSPTFTLPASGGDYTITFRTACGSCDSVLTYNLHLDSIAPTRDTTMVVFCDDVRKEGYHWVERPDTVYYDYCTDSVVLYSPSTTCDSIIYLNLVEPVRVYQDTMVLPESLPFSYRGRQYNATMVDTIPISETNCDTTWVFNFEVYESLLASMPDSFYVLCEKAPMLTLVYDIQRGRSLRYSYTFDKSDIPSITPVSEVQKKGRYEIEIPLSATLNPNIYAGKLVLEDSIPKWNVTIPFTFEMRYASSVITQRWNDVLAIRNADYNGGYQFDSVQWYLNGMPIEGATDFVYYTGEGQTLRHGEEYTALLTRADGVVVFTCPFVPSAVPGDINDMPSLVPVSSSVHLPGKGTASWYDAMGRPYSVSEYDNSDVAVPAVAGYYLLVLQGEGTRLAHPILVRP